MRGLRGIRLWGTRGIRFASVSAGVVIDGAVYQLGNEAPLTQAHSWGTGWGNYDY